METMAAHAKPAQVQARRGPSTEQGKQTQVPTHNLIKLPAVDSKGEINFLQWTLTGYINHTSRQSPCPGVVGQHKMDSAVFCKKKKKQS